MGPPEPLITPLSPHLSSSGAKIKGKQDTQDRDPTDGMKTIKDICGWRDASTIAIAITIYSSSLHNLEPLLLITVKFPFPSADTAQ